MYVRAFDLPVSGQGRAGQWPVQKASPAAGTGPHPNPLPKSKGTSCLFLDLGVVKNIAQVRLNGRDLGVVWTARGGLKSPARQADGQPVEDRRGEPLAEPRHARLVASARNMARQDQRLLPERPALAPLRLLGP